MTDELLINKSESDLIELLRSCWEQGKHEKERVRYFLQEIQSQKNEIRSLEARLNNRKIKERAAEFAQCVQELERSRSPYKVLDMDFETFEKILKTTGVADGINIKDWLQNPSNKLILRGNPRESLMASKILSVLLRSTLDDNSNHAVLESARQKQIENADEFATRMYKVVTELKREEKVSTFRDTVNALNKNDIPTYRQGGKWHVGSLQNLQKRWEKLGLTQAKPDQP